MELHLTGVSARRVEDITEALWGTRVSPGTVSKLNKTVYKQIEGRRNLPIEGTYPCGLLTSIPQLGPRVNRNFRALLSRQILDGAEVPKSVVGLILVVLPERPASEVPHLG